MDGKNTKIMANSHRSQNVHNNYLVKDIVRAANTPKVVANIAFGMFDGHEMARLAEIPVISRELYRLPSRKPSPHGVLDPRMGVSNKSDRCGTCGETLANCPGHFGVINLELPVFHIGFFKATVTLLQCICKSCARVLLPEKDRIAMLRRMRNPRLNALTKVGILKRVVDICKRQSKCQFCNAYNGTVKRVPGASLMIVHERFKGRGSEGEREAMMNKFDSAIEHNKEVASHLSRVSDTMTPLHTLQLFKHIHGEDLPLLWMDADRGRPEHMILTKVLVPPVCIRPSVAMDAGGGSNEDDLTVKLQEVIHINNALRTALERGASNAVIREEWDFLQVQVAAFLHGELPGLPPSVRPKKPIRGLCQRLKGKQGRFRGNLSGKRVDFSGRTVIGPDPNLPIFCVGVPELVARTMTYPERVTRSNIERLRQAVRNGTQYPGANFIKTKDGFTKSLQYGDRDRIAAQLQIGDIVERHMIDDDPVLFNRQPSLHKMSIMSHRARIRPGRTFRFNECVCSPYNADFDGDEMNLHLPQTEEARTEASLLMDVRENIITPRSGEPLVAACQDFITAGYLLTRRDVFFDKDHFCQVVSFLSDATERIELPQPAILKPVPLWTGKQVISLLLRPTKDSPIAPTFEMKARSYSGKRPDGHEWKEMDPVDGYVVFRNGEHMCGVLDKKSLGGSKTGLIYVLCRDYTSTDAANAMLRLTKMCTRWLTNRGFSIGIEDVMPSDELAKQKNSMVEEGYDHCNKSIAQFQNGTLPLQPGCNEEQSLESELNGVLGKLRDTIGQMCVKRLPYINAPRIMADCGSKGSTLNICQMIACVGQQAVNGARIPEGFINRTLPIFYPKAKAPAAKGFVANSFFTGLTATEFFFHTMGGREGLVDTAVKTAETGYMQRRMMKALEDLSVAYDRTVRTASNDIVQFEYGDDGLDPATMEDNDTPVNFSRLFENVRAQASLAAQKQVMLNALTDATASSKIAEFNGVASSAHLSQSLVPQKLRQYARAVLRNPGYAKLLPQGKKFHEELISFVDSLADARETTPETNKEETTEDIEMTEVNHGNLPQNTNTTESNVLMEEEPDTRRALKVTAEHLKHVFSRALHRYYRANVAAGEAVGAIAAHSCGEPATQMTLKTFHFAGVASMNVTLGVPRIKEIMNASKVISTPIIEAPLVSDRSEVAARVAKARIEKTTLGEIAAHIREIYQPSGAFLEIQLDLKAITALHLDITAASVADALLNAPKLKLKAVNVIVAGEDTLQITPPSSGYKTRISAASTAAAKSASGTGAKSSSSSSTGAVGELEDDEASTLRRSVQISDATQRASHYYGLQLLKVALPQVPVQGIPTVNRAVITQEDSADGTRYKLLVEGYDLVQVMGTPGIDSRRAKSNHIIEIQQTLGIEAARTMIISELTKTYGSYGIGIDPRHLMLLSDVMTYRGEVLGITRFGIAKMKDSVMMLASFEKTPDHLFDAAVHSRVDAVMGVSECIIMGVPIPLGTGAVKLVQSPRNLPYIETDSDTTNVMTHDSQMEETNTKLNNICETGSSHKDMMASHSCYYQPPAPLLGQNSPVSDPEGTHQAWRAVTV